MGAAEVKDKSTDPKSKPAELAKPGDNAPARHESGSGKPELNLLSITGGADQGGEEKQKAATREPSSLTFDNPFAPSDQTPASRTVEKPVGDRTEQSDRIASNDLPPGSVERLNDRLAEMLAKRNKEFNLSGAQKELEFQQSKEFDLQVNAIGACERLNIHLKETVFNSDLDNPELMRHLLKDHPAELQTYERYWKNITTQGRLRVEMDNEMHDRRAGVASIINEEGKSLFPGSTMPEFKVIATPLGSTNTGSYFLKSGELALRDELLNPNVTRGEALTNTVLHEMKHGEQGGLLLRKMIDDAVPVGSQADKLTEPQKADIQKELQKQFGYTVDEAVIDSVFSQRAGVRLNANERARAESLIESKREFLESEKLGTTRARIKDLENFLDRYERLEDMSKTSSREYITRMFGKDIPEGVRQELERQSQIEHPTQMDKLSLTAIVGKELRAQLRAEKKNSAEVYSAYRNRLHELEASEVGRTSDARLEAAKVARLENNQLRIGDKPSDSPTETTDHDGLANATEMRNLLLLERFWDEKGAQRRRIEREEKAPPKIPEKGGSSSAIVPISILISAALDSYLKEKARVERYTAPTQ